MSSPASLGLTKEGNEYRILGKKGGLIKINKLTVPQLKAYGAKYTTFNSKNRTKKQVLNKIYAAKTKLREAANSGNNIAASLLSLQNQAPKSSSSYNANAAAASALVALAKHKPAGGKARISALLNQAAQKPSVSSASAAASLGLLPNLGASGGYRFKGAKGPKKANKTMTLAVLKAYAANHGVNATNLRTKKAILNAIHRKKYGNTNGGAVNAALNNILANVVKPSPAHSSMGMTALFKTPPKAKAKAKARPRPSGSPASFGLLQQFGASGGYRFKGVRGPKKANKTMTVAALKAYAAKHGVKANTLRTKNAILAAIHRKKYGGSSSSSSGSSSVHSGPVVISQAAAAAILKARPRSSSSNGPHKRPAPRPKVQGPAAKPKRLTAAQLNALLGN